MIYPLFFIEFITHRDMFHCDNFKLTQGAPVMNKGMCIHNVLFVAIHYFFFVL